MGRKDGICPRCSTNPRESGKSYCQPCSRRYYREHHHRRDEEGEAMKAEIARLRTLVFWLGGNPDAT